MINILTFTLPNTTNTLLSALQEKVYQATKAKLQAELTVVADDDVQEVSGPDGAKKKEMSHPDDANKKEICPPDNATKSKTSGSKKRKRGRPRKVEPALPTNPGIDQFATDAIAERLEGKPCREKKKGRQTSSPYKEL